MARFRQRSRRPSTAALSLVVVLLVLLAGVLFRYAPFLTQARQPVAGVPAPPGMVIATHFALPARRRACLDSVSMMPQSQLVGFSIYPGPSSPHGGAPVQVTFAAPVRVTAGTAYVDLAVALLTARGTDGYQTVWFHQRLSAACAKHEQ